MISARGKLGIKSTNMISAKRGHWGTSYFGMLKQQFQMSCAVCAVIMQCF
jgi:hypothetical protein